jgi:hypothetical protein
VSRDRRRGFRAARNKSTAIAIRLPGAALSMPGEPGDGPARDRTQSEATMYDHASPPSLGGRDIVAAWLVCLAVAVPGLVYSEATARTETGVVEAGAGSHPRSAAPETAIRAAAGPCAAAVGG